MTEFRVFETDQFQKDLQLIARAGMTQMAAKLRAYVYPQLRSNPFTGSNIKRLKGPYSDIWRYRIGAWRFFYKMDVKRKIVFMIAASHRSSSY